MMFKINERKNMTFFNLSCLRMLTGFRPLLSAELSLSGASSSTEVLSLDLRFLRRTYWTLLLLAMDVL